MSLRIQYIDPEQHSTRKSEFRLHGKCYLSNIKLCLNMVGNGGNFSGLPGAYGMIKHIRLMSGGVEIDSCRFANYWMAWKNQNQTNAQNRNIRHKLAQNTVGYSLTTGLYFQAAAQVTHNLTSTSASESAGVLNLMEVLPILKEQQVWNTDLIPNLKIVIEYNDNQSLMKSDTSNVGSVSAPILIATEVLDEKAISESAKQQGQVWSSIEHDSFVLPEGVAGQVQKVTQRINGFDNKVVEKFVMMKHLYPPSKNLQGTFHIGHGPYASMVQHKEELNYILNSKPVFPRNIKERAEKGMILAEAWDRVNILPYSNQSSIGGNKNGASIQQGQRVGIPFPQNSIADPYPSAKIGQSDYSGCVLQSRVNQFEVVYQRLPVTDTSTVKKMNESLEFKFFALVSKQVKYQMGQPPIVSYS